MANPAACVASAFANEDDEERPRVIGTRADRYYPSDRMRFRTARRLLYHHRGFFVMMNPHESSGIDFLEIIAYEGSSSSVPEKGFRRVFNNQMFSGIDACRTVGDLADIVRAGFTKKDGWVSEIYEQKAKCAVQADTCESDPAPTVLHASAGRSQNSLVMKFIHDMVPHPIEIRVELPAARLSASTRMDLLSECAPYRSFDSFRLADDSREEEEGLRIFHEGQAVTRLSNGTRQVAITTGAPHESGRHYVEVRILKSRALDTGLFVENDHVRVTFKANGTRVCTFKNGEHRPWNTEEVKSKPFGTLDYVGLMLDVDAGMVILVINGDDAHRHYIARDSRSGVVGPCSFGVELCYAGDACKLASKYCWHHYS